jgi:hypothetical protein
MPIRRARRRNVELFGGQCANRVSCYGLYLGQDTVQCKENFVHCTISRCFLFQVPGTLSAQHNLRHKPDPQELADSLDIGTRIMARMFE